jgi:hypothetical protein
MREVHVGVVVDGPSPRYIEALELFQKEITGLLSRDFRIRFDQDKRLVADHSAAGVQKALDQLLAD